MTEVSETLYRRNAKYYDLLFSYRDYGREARFISAMCQTDVKRPSILDVACGTANQLKILAKKGWRVFGIDKNREMLAIAKRKVKRGTFKTGDMRSFRIGEKFDVVACMFSAINYNLSSEDLARTFRNFRRHLKEKGMIIVDFPQDWSPGITAKILDEGKVISVMESTIKQNRIVRITIYLVIRKGKKAMVVKNNEWIRIHTVREMRKAAERAGLRCRFYWDWDRSKTRKRGRRPIMVCASTEN